MTLENTHSRSDEAAQAAGAVGASRAVPAQEDAPGVEPEAPDTGGVDSYAAWQAYAMFAVRTSGGIPAPGADVAGWIHRTLELRRGLVVRSRPKRPRRIYW